MRSRVRFHFHKSNFFPVTISAVSRLRVTRDVDHSRHCTQDLSITVIIESPPESVFGSLSIYTIYTTVLIPYMNKQYRCCLRSCRRLDLVILTAMFFAPLFHFAFTCFTTCFRFFVIIFTLPVSTTCLRCTVAVSHFATVVV